MTSSSDSSIEDILAQRIVNGQRITIPGFEDLNESQQPQIIARRQNLTRFRKGASAAVATEPLIDKRDPTPPPPSKEEVFIECQGFEIKARQDLEAEGCPPAILLILRFPCGMFPKNIRE
ncbi:hypothetical protein MMC18_005780 [Xylographa bjoerkii]|nr:hypothetical protein [Xylographa bjoerkii]